MRVLKFGLKSSQVLGLGIVLLLLLAVACGTAATATPAPTSTPQPTAVASSASASAAVATATPAPTATPAAPVVNTGKVTWMTSSWGTARFDPNFAPGGLNHQYSPFVHGFLIVINEKSELLPGIATKWEISKDGKTWTFTIQRGRQVP